MSAFVARVERVTAQVAELSVVDLATRRPRKLGAAELLPGVALAAGDRVLATDLDTGGIAIIRRLPALT
jgi:hypothetical protein